MIAAAQQQLGRTDTAGTDHHSVGRQGDIAAFVEITHLQLVAGAIRGNTAYLVQGSHLGAKLFRQRQIIQVQRVLGLSRAADVAVAAVDAGALSDALIIYPGS